MVERQDIAPIEYRKADVVARGNPISETLTLQPMGREAKRTEYGARLYASRKKADLTQTQLANAVGIRQSTIAELERIGNGSAFTAQLAAVLRVDPEWLANGLGPAPSSAPPGSPTLEQALDVVIGALESLDESSHRAAVEKLQAAAQAPDSKLMRNRLLEFLMKPRVSTKPDGLKKSPASTGTNDAEGSA